MSEPEERWEEYKARQQANRRRQRLGCTLVGALLLALGLGIRNAPRLKEILGGAPPTVASPDAPIPAEPTPVPPAISRTVELSSSPAGAAVYLGGKRRGTTPCQLALPLDRTLQAYLIHPEAGLGRVILAPEESARVRVDLPRRPAWSARAGWWGPRGGHHREARGSRLGVPLAPVWEARLGQREITGLAAAGPTILVSSGVKDLAAFALETGAALWDLGGAGSAGGPVTDGEFAVVACKSRRIRVVQTEKGKERPGSELPTSLEVPLTMTESRLMACYPSGRVDGLRVKRKRRKISLEDGWTAETGARVTAAPLLAEGRLFVPASAGLACLDETTGEMNWNHAVPEEASGSDNSAPGLRRVADRLRAPGPLLAGDRLIYLDASGGLQALSPASGQVFWHRMLPRSPGGELSSAGEILYVPLSGGGIAALDLRDGQPIWTAQVGGDRWLQPALTPEILWLAGPEGRVTALDRLLGEPIWESEPGPEITAGPVLLPGWLLVGCSDGTIRAFHPSG